MTFAGKIRSLLPATSVELCSETGENMIKVNAILQYLSTVKRNPIRRTDRYVLSEKNRTGPAPFIWENAERT